jgi:hypothetical protein
VPPARMQEPVAVTAWLTFQLDGEQVAHVEYPTMDSAAGHVLRLNEGEEHLPFEWDAVIPYSDEHPPPDVTVTHRYRGLLRPA